MAYQLITTPNPISDFSDDLDLLKDFFVKLSQGTLFDTTDRRYHRRLRSDVRIALHRLIDAGRPFLESECGILWPYEAIQSHTGYLEEALENNNAFQNDQARRYLSLLPFPNQWHYLLAWPQYWPEDQEIDAFLTAEHQRLARKAQKKRQKTFLLHHLCQVLKPPELPLEKGVLRIFSLPYIWLDPNLLGYVSKHYILYVEPSAGIHMRFAWLRHFANLENPTLIGAAAREDRLFLNTQPGIRTTHLCHGDYVDPDANSETSIFKSYDLVFNGTFNDMPLKRHELFLKLLNTTGLKHVSALVLGRGTPDNVDRFRKMVQQYNLEARVETVANLKRSQVPGYLRKSKVGVHLCLHENGCRSIAEFICTGLPCVVSALTSGVSEGMINGQTGVAVPDADLAMAIKDVLTNYRSYAPRDWFLSHSGSYRKSEELNQVLKELYAELGATWRTDIVPIGSSGVNRYAHKKHLKRFMPEFEKIYRWFRKMPALSVPIVGP